MPRYYRVQFPLIPGTRRDIPSLPIPLPLIFKKVKILFVFSTSDIIPTPLEPIQFLCKPYEEDISIEIID